MHLIRKWAGLILTRGVTLQRRQGLLCVLTPGSHFQLLQPEWKKCVCDYARPSPTRPAIVGPWVGDAAVLPSPFLCKGTGWSGWESSLSEFLECTNGQMLLISYGRATCRHRSRSAAL